MIKMSKISVNPISSGLGLDVSLLIDRLPDESSGGNNQSLLHDIQKEFAAHDDNTEMSSYSATAHTYYDDNWSPHAN